LLNLKGNKFLPKVSGEVYWPTTNDGRQRRFMDIADWRRKIDEIDRKLVELVNERAHAAHEIGKLKRGLGMPIYEPDREHKVFDNAKQVNKGPLPDRDLLRIYERIMDVMRQIQVEEIAPERMARKNGLGDTELDPEVND
jgi:chorismate mutase